MLSRIPQATYRVQFNHLFTFKQASELINYWYDLGITDIYASPITKARAKSLYGYDVVDHTQINPEIGTEREFIDFAMQLKNKNMGLILDIVPNHMCVSTSDNFWWKDVLENGPHSIYANYFDISWDSTKKELKNKVFLPILSQQLGKVIEDQELQIFYDAGAFFFKYQEISLPINPDSWIEILKAVDADRLNSLEENDEDLLEFESLMTALEYLSLNASNMQEKIKKHNREKEIIKKRLKLLLQKRNFFHELIQSTLTKLNGIKGYSESFNDLEVILKKQPYRLGYWRLSNDLINYRRFFDINDLACMHVENEEVFIAIHSFILKLVDEGLISGLRIDHIDGLYEPEEYLKRLRNQGVIPQHLYLIVEKILVGQERLNLDWPVQGTTGYDYLNILNRVFVKSESQESFQQIYESFIGYPNRLAEIVGECKKLVLQVSMASELNILTRCLEEISEQHRASYDYSYEGLHIALRDIVANFSVYRSYIKFNDTEVAKDDQKIIFKAIEQAKKENPATDHLVFDFIKNVLLLNNPPGLSEKQLNKRKEFILHFQQLTGPVMAKGFEDTALYRSYALSSLNEVGMDAHKFGISLDNFHQENIERFKHYPHALLATSTHDTKRSEDVRARIHVLSEIPQEWQEALVLWKGLNQSKKIEVDACLCPDANEEYLLYQTLIGSWPTVFDGSEQESDRTLYIQRIQDYMRKALKEAKIHTSWINPREEYEEAVCTFVKRILDPKNDNRFLLHFQEFVKNIQAAGLWNSLSQTVLKMTVPGVPDFYQGSEIWQFTLVDPDNRHSIDFAVRQTKLTSIKQQVESDFSLFIKKVKEQSDEDSLKLFLIWKVLNFRNDNADLFQTGKYQALQVEGKMHSHVIAFSRSKDQNYCIILVARFFIDLLNKKQNLMASEVWEDTQLNLPEFASGIGQDIISAKEFDFKGSKKIALRELFENFPFVILRIRKDEGF